MKNWTAIEDNKIIARYNGFTPIASIAASLYRTEESVKERLDYLLKIDQINDAETGSENKLDLYV
jgi:hypothetical protein